jgi:hypothetical protein
MKTKTLIRNLTLSLLAMGLVPVSRAGDLLDHWMWRNPLPTGQLLNAFAYGNGLHVGVGAYGAIVTSPDGVTWTLESSGVTNTLFGVAHGNGLFVAVGTSGRILISPDGRNWTSRPSGTSSHLFGVVRGNDRFVAVGSQVMTTSPDGLAWSSAAKTVGFSEVTFGNGLCVAVGSSGSILTSTNGINWTTQASGTTAFLSSVAFGNGVFVAVGGEVFNGALLRSTNGVNWTRLTSGVPPNGKSIAYGNGRFVLIENGIPISTNCWASLDGLQWTRTTVPFDMMAVDFGESHFLLFSDGIMTSPDGVSWTTRTTSVTSGNLRDVTFASGIYVAVGSAIVTSPEGQTWTERVSPTSNLALERITHGQGLFVSVGAAGKVLTSPDGMQWATQASGTMFNLFDVAHGNGQFLATGPNAAYTQRAFVTSTNGTNWTVSVENGSPFWGLAFGKGVYVAVGSSGAIRTSTNGTVWTSRASGTTYPLNDVAFGGNQFVAVGGAGTIVTSPDGLTWTRRLETGNGPDTSYWVGFCGGVYLASAAGGPTFISTDGVRWTQRFEYMGGAFAFGAGQFIALDYANWIRSCDARPRLGKASFLADGTPRIPIYGVSGLGYSIEASSNLTDWSLLTTAYVPTGTGSFFDLAATNSDQRFYRAITPP